MDTQRHNLAREIARLEAALDPERRALDHATDHRRRRALQRNLAAAYEELGALYRRLDALDGDADPSPAGLIHYGELPAGAGY